MLLFFDAKIQKKSDTTKFIGAKGAKNWPYRLKRLKRLKCLSVFFAKHTFAERQNS